MKTNKGISLIVLAITIIVMGILLSAIVLSVKDEEVSVKTYEMKFKSDLAAFKEELQDYIQNKEYEYTSRGEVYDRTLLTATNDYIYYDNAFIESKTIYDIIPSLEDAADEYQDKIVVENGLLKYNVVYQENAGVENQTADNNNQHIQWAEQVGLETNRDYTETSNIMRTVLFDSAELESPYDNHTFRAEKINDGEKTNDFFHTNGAQDHQNIGWGAKVIFKEKVPLKKIILYGYAFKVKELTVEAYVDGKWEIVKAQEFNNVNPYVIDLSENVVLAKEWKVYISKITERNSNFYAFELEAYM